ncbi:MAG: barstar family protein [Christensenellaceae bacterium]|nr:barstar family protein [Christensenellaceae bacterium]
MIKQVLLDLSKFKSIAEIHSFLSKELGFEDYYGYNLDALYDSLSTLFTKTSIEIINFNQINGVYKKDVERMLNVFDDVAEESEYFNYTF